MQLRSRVEIQAPAKHVFEMVTTPERLPEWNSSARRAWRRVAEPVRLGSRAVMVGQVLGQEVESETEVTGWDPPRLFVTRAVRGPRLQTVFHIEDLTVGCRVTIDVTGDVPGGRLGAVLAERLLGSELERSLGRLRALCESAEQHGPS